jgi:hypothetical protein
MRRYICVHRVMAPPAGPLIDAATRAFLSPPWTFPSGPASHAFVVLADESLRVRLDGQPPRSTLGIYVPATRADEAAWEVALNGRQDEAAVVSAADRMTGVAYDPLELLGQVLPGLGRAPGIPQARICTAVALNVLGAVAGAREQVTARISTLYPEALADALQKASSDHPGRYRRAW